MQPTIRSAPNGSTYTCNLQVFKRWKKNFNTKYFEIYGIKFKEAVKDREVRQAIYETVLKVQNLKMFNDKEISYKIDDEILKRALEIEKLIRQS